MDNPSCLEAKTRTGEVTIRLFKKLRSVELNFYTMLVEQVDVAVQNAKLLARATQPDFVLEDMLKRLNLVRKKGEKVSEQINLSLNKTFLTPLDREDIYAISKGLNEVNDSLNFLIEKLLTYQVPGSPKAFTQLVRLTLNSVYRLQKIIANLPAIKKDSTPIVTWIKEIQQLETSGDQLYHQAIDNLLKNSGDLVTIIKWKDLYDLVEKVIDCCEKTGLVVRGVVIKYA